MSIATKTAGGKANTASKLIELPGAQLSRKGPMALSRRDIGAGGQYIDLGVLTNL